MYSKSSDQKNYYSLANNFLLMNSDLERLLEQLLWIYSPDFRFRVLVEDALNHMICI